MGGPEWAKEQLINDLKKLRHYDAKFDEKNWVQKKFNLV